MSHISSVSSMPSWEAIKETALQNENLTADIRDRDDVVQVNAPNMWQQFKVMIGWEKAPVYASREETLTNLREQLGVDFSQKLRTLIKETGIPVDSKEYKTLVTDSMQSFDVITQKLTAAMAAPTVSTSQATQEAHQGTLNSFFLLRKRFAQPQLIPQFCKITSGEWSVLQPAPHPENLALSGGGVKGAGYVGWFKAAERAGVLTRVKRLAGSSAGAITAALLASGMNAEDFEKASRRTSFWSILTGKSHDPVVTQGISLKATKWSLNFEGTYAVERVNAEMVGSIKKYFQSLGTGGLKQKIQNATLQLSDEDKKTLLTLEAAIVPAPHLPVIGWLFAKKLPTHMLTFQELALLVKMDPRFKELTITGYDKTKREAVYYSVTNQPKLAIAEAVRASMSLPGIFQPIRDLASGDMIEDGAVKSNIPVEAFFPENASEKEKEAIRAKTLVLGFDDNGRFYQITNRGKIHKDVGVIEPLLSGNPAYQKTADDDAQKLYDAGPNAMDVAHGMLNITSFMASDKTLRAAEHQAEIRAMETFSLRQNQAIDQIFTSLEEAMKAMSGSELEDIAKHYASKIDAKDSLSESDRQAISKAAKDELTQRSQPELPI